MSRRLFAVSEPLLHVARMVNTTTVCQPDTSNSESWMDASLSVVCLASVGWVLWFRRSYAWCKWFLLRFTTSSLHVPMIDLPLCHVSGSICEPMLAWRSSNSSRFILTCPKIGYEVMKSLWLIPLFGWSLSRSFKVFSIARYVPQLSFMKMLSNFVIHIRDRQEIKCYESVSISPLKRVYYWPNHAFQCRLFFVEPVVQGFCHSVDMRVP